MRKSKEAPFVFGVRVEGVSFFDDERSDNDFCP